MLSVISERNAFAVPALFPDAFTAGLALALAIDGADGLVEAGGPLLGAHAVVGAVAICQAGVALAVNIADSLTARGTKAEKIIRKLMEIIFILKFFCTCLQYYNGKAPAL